MYYNIGDNINGTVSGIKQYGIFIKFDEVFGFCHISNCSHKFIKNLNELFSIGQEIKAKIIEIDSNNRINLSIKDCENQIVQSEYKPKIEKLKQKYKNPPQFEKITNNNVSSFDDMLKLYLKNSEEQLNCIGKRTQKHNKR